MDVIPAAAAVLIRAGHVLMVRRTKAPQAGMWAFPGGGAHGTESAGRTALRELREETGIRARAGPILIVRDVPLSAATTYRLVLVRCTWVAGTPEAASDADRVAWVPVDAVATGDRAVVDGTAEAVARSLAAASRP